jgi:hypothetical protein
MKNRRSAATILLILVSIYSAGSTDVSDLHPGAAWGLSAHSENGQFAAVLIRPPDINDCVLEVYEVNAPENKQLWKANVPLKHPHGAIFVSNGGRYVTRLDTDRQAEGDALEFYVREQGKIKGYSREQLLSFCQALTGKGKWDLFPTFYMFHTFEGLTFFCGLMWSQQGSCWVAWNAATGDLIEVNQTLEPRMTDDARRHFRKQLAQQGQSGNKIVACAFLSRWKRTEDRRLVEKMLQDRDFITNPVWVEKPSFLTQLFRQININTEKRYQLDYLYASSGYREFADRALAEWDGKVVGRNLRWRAYPYHYLGTVRLKVVLKGRPKKDGGLWVYLLPESVDRAEWDQKRPEHYLAEEFDGLGSEYEIGRTIPCIFGGVTPGKYCIKAVWDKAKPFEPFNRRSDDFCRPQNGDYESADSPVIEVKAGQTVDVGVIQCKQKVKGK